jgi:HEPN domain-containing protein
MSPRDHAEVLLSKAKDDQVSLRILTADAKAPAEMIGFCAQQAVEKALKAVLTHKSVEYRRTHDIAELLDLATAEGINVAPVLEDAKRLTPFAASFRYDYMPDERDVDKQLDIAWANQVVHAAVEWAEQSIRKG